MTGQRLRGVSWVPASTAQRDKVVGMTCLVCGGWPVDPAHVVPRRLGGCDHRDCVIPLCRTHHRLYDSCRFDLWLFVAGRIRRERAHALLHVGPAALRRGLTGGGWSLARTRTVNPWAPIQRPKTPPSRST